MSLSKIGHLALAEYSLSDLSSNTPGVRHKIQSLLSVLPPRLWLPYTAAVASKISVKPGQEAQAAQVVQLLVETDGKLCLDRDCNLRCDGVINKVNFSSSSDFLLFCNVLTENVDMSRLVHIACPRLVRDKGSHYLTVLRSAVQKAVALRTLESVKSAEFDTDLLDHLVAYGQLQELCFSRPVSPSLRTNSWITLSHITTISHMTSLHTLVLSMPLECPTAIMACAAAILCRDTLPQLVNFGCLDLSAICRQNNCHAQAVCLKRLTFYGMTYHPALVNLTHTPTSLSTNILTLLGVVTPLQDIITGWQYEDSAYCFLKVTMKCAVRIMVSLHNVRLLLTEAWKVSEVIMVNSWRPLTDADMGMICEVVQQLPNLAHVKLPGRFAQYSQIVRLFNSRHLYSSQVNIPYGFL